MTRESFCGNANGTLPRNGAKKFRFVPSNARIHGNSGFIRRVEPEPIEAPGTAAAFRAAAAEVLSLSLQLPPCAELLDEDGAESLPLIEGAARSLLTAFDEAMAGATDGGFPADRTLRHDIGNWLQTIGGFTTLLLMESGLPAEARECLERLDARTRELVSLLHA
jgi:hypothetical protein